MTSCNICLEGFKQPVSLPCGHIFCTECVIKTVQAVQPMRNVHTCPMCRAPYNIAPLNPLVLPPHLRPFITPTIRRVYIDSPEQSKDTSTSIPPNVAEELARLRHENQTLKSHCTLWRRRAELHGSATLGLLDFARMVRDQAAALARERDDWARRCHTLKRKLDDCGQSSQPPASGPCPESLSSAFTFSYPPPSHSRNASYIPASLSEPSTSYPVHPVDSSRLAVAALCDFHSCHQPGASHRPQASVNLDHWSRHPQNPASSSSSLIGAAPSSSSYPSVSSVPHTQTHLGQPPAKRARRDVVETCPGSCPHAHTIAVLTSSSASTSRVSS